MVPLVIFISTCCLHVALLSSCFAAGLQSDRKACESIKYHLCFLLILQRDYILVVRILRKHIVTRKIPTTTRIHHPQHPPLVKSSWRKPTSKPDPRPPRPPSLSSIDSALPLCACLTEGWPNQCRSMSLSLCRMRIFQGPPELFMPKYS